MISRVMKRDFTNMISRVMKRDREATGQDQDVLVNLPRLASNLQEEEYNPYFDGKRSSLKNMVARVMKREYANMVARVMKRSDPYVRDEDYNEYVY